MGKGNPQVQLKVRLILYDKGQILLLRQTKPNGGNYTLVGGTAEPGETSKEALIRESFEEAGIRLRAEDLQLVHVLEKKFRTGKRRLVFYFKTQRWEGYLKSGEPDKFKKATWFDIENLPEKLTETVHHVLTQYRKGQIFSELIEK